MSRKIGILGGTFDPIHWAHLLLAERASEQFGLDQVLFIPAAQPPHKRTRLVTEGWQRLEMVQLAIAGNPAFDVSSVELERAGTSYTADTLRQLCAGHPDAEWYLLLGADNVADLAGWREPAEIARLARICVTRRPGHPLDLGRLSPPFTRDEIARIEGRTIAMPLLELSGREIRERASQGRSIRYLVPAAVEAYIQAKGLYR